MFVYSILSTTPIWALFGILFALTYGAIFVGRHVFEGVPYQVSYSAFIGDGGLLVAVMIAATILQRGNATIPPLLSASWVHIAIYFVTLVAGVIVCVVTLKSRDGKLMDMYHDVVIAPVIMYLACTLLPVLYAGGTTVEKITTSGVIILWLVCVIYDFVGDRINQRVHLEQFGLNFPM